MDDVGDFAGSEVAVPLDRKAEGRKAELLQFAQGEISVLVMVWTGSALDIPEAPILVDVHLADIPRPSATTEQLDVRCHLVGRLGPVLRVDGGKGLDVLLGEEFHLVFSGGVALMVGIYDG